MFDTLNYILKYYSYILYLALGIFLLWAIIICIELILNKYYGYNRFSFSQTYYRKRLNVSSSMNSI
jgi:hypothetical protein